MNFFKSVFSDPTPPISPNSETTPPIQPEPPSNPWGFGSTLLTAIASKSETLIDNYYKDLQEFSSGLQKETSVIRQAASRAVKDLPSRLESGAAIAQESLEAVGQAIDNVGSTVSEIINKDLNLASQGGFFNSQLDEIDDDDGKGSSFSENAKPFSRIDAMIRSVQCSFKTYCDEVENSDYNEWKIGFNLEKKSEEIEQLFEENEVIKELYNEVVPKKVDEETFWCRYFYRIKKVIEAEETRARIVKRAISEEEEELTWDVEDDENDESRKEIKGNGKNEDEACVSGTKGEDDILDERLKCDDKEGSDGKIESDFSVVSSQRFDEDSLGWDEIEAFGSGDEGKVADNGIPSPRNIDHIKKRLNSSEEDEEELSWDVEEEEENVKL